PTEPLENQAIGQQNMGACSLLSAKFAESLKEQSPDGPHSRLSSECPVPPGPSITPTVPPSAWPALSTPAPACPPASARAISRKGPAAPAPCRPAPGKQRSRPTGRGS